MKMEVEEWMHVSYYGQVPLIGRRHSSLGILLPSSSLDLAVGDQVLAGLIVLYD